ncbi:hypothetical protein SAMN05660909_03248 [Chitinophaga terrae (ex Kim and Jung 2007)]|uniref:ABC transporter permease subunit n=1 Tax=Chitinophaga terrae (ex Kim and Jung 2007) TaxID=408074 RepID=A0A1H4DPS8_9BACT|nr:ABC transporter permease [Chitinophaga terrae (ex Kim and Jung 2007)]MDQ0107875.1 hypothetical protein [Chitinophaga terrae (ex Kim and Jung 2007)]GEP91046.1 hypothetical protein CTE07_26910 [Chitinophaga terrae (ex Kim and Jung 2007)]SEA74526.1 hypothetical protein SAMN05660909_03248 [Chitinophaga terrae (ex Kim and Jung 2007)]
MKSIIYTEWLKVKTYRTFWLMALLMLVVIPAGNMILVNVISNNLKQVSTMLGNPFNFPDLWQTMASFDSYVSPLPGFLLIILITNEYTYRTNRQNIIDGWERKEFVISKLFWLFLLALANLLVATISALVVGLTSGDKPLNFAGYEYMIYYGLQVLVTLTIAMVIAVFAKRAGLSIIIFAAYLMMGDQLLSFLGKKYLGKVGGLLPIQSGDELLPFPLVGKLTTVEKYESIVYIIAILVYIFLGIWLVFRKVLKSDL